MANEAMGNLFCSAPGFLESLHGLTLSHIGIQEVSRSGSASSFWADFFDSLLVDTSIRRSLTVLIPTRELSDTIRHVQADMVATKFHSEDGQTYFLLTFAPIDVPELSSSTSTSTSNEMRELEAHEITQEEVILQRQQPIESVEREAKHLSQFLANVRHFQLPYVMIAG
jgi:hypothetical protein